ncbi:MAG: ABC transporter substrate-binding protein [Deinococcota bacterium]
MKKAFVLLVLIVLGISYAQDTPVVEILEVTEEDRLVRHAFGETRVPLNPQRVATLIPGGGVDYFFTYGVVPVAAADLNGFGWSDSARPTYYELLEFPIEVTADEIEGIGCCAGSYSLETLLAANPDVIIGWDYQFGDAYDEFSAIAPSVAIDPTNGPQWIEAGRLIAEVIGRSEQHEVWLASYEATVEDLREQYAEFGDPSDVQVTFLNGSNPTALRICAPGESQMTILAETVGFSVTELPDGVGEGACPELSLELLPAADADVIFITTNFFEPERRDTFFAEGFGSTEIWQSLEAVQNDRVYFIDTFFWTNGGPSVNTQVVLPDMFAAIYENQDPRFSLLEDAE